jgi:prevent-host-death family protein
MHLGRIQHDCPRTSSHDCSDERIERRLTGGKRTTNGVRPVDQNTSISDNPIVTEISATDASKRFADVLDAVEHRGESFTVVRRGRAIATVAPSRRSTLGELRGFVRDHAPDSEWGDDVADLRRFVGGAPMSDPWKD